MDILRDPHVDTISGYLRDYTSDISNRNGGYTILRHIMRQIYAKVWEEKKRIGNNRRY